MGREMATGLNRINDGERLARLEARSEHQGDALEEIKDMLIVLQRDMNLVKMDVQDMRSRARGGWFVLCTIGAVVVGLVAVVSNIWKVAQ